MEAGLRRELAGAQVITVLTGAGISAESGVPTFRDAQSGLWARYDPMQLATPEAFDDDPDLVWAWYMRRVQMLREVEPNAGHRALAELATLTEVRIVTQNVDDLHERAGSTVLAHLHGSLAEVRCADCGRPARLPDIPAQIPERLAPPRCRRCGGPVRPGVVWFGEMLPVRAFEDAEQAVTECDVALVVGTSGAVYPAAGLPMMARARGATVVEVNPDETEISDHMHHCLRAPATVALPEIVAVVREGRAGR